MIHNRYIHGRGILTEEKMSILSTRTELSTSYILSLEAGGYCNLACVSVQLGFQMQPKTATIMSWKSS